MSTDTECIFCQIVAGTAKAKFVYEDVSFVAFEDIAPRAPVHVLVVPRKHVARVMDIELETNPEFSQLMEVIQKVAKKLEISQAFQIRINNGRDAGQIVDHVHVHLMGGYDENHKASV